MLALLSGCSGLTKTECRLADFSALGYADASKGRLRDHFERYHEKCLSYDIDIADELVMYDYGRERGLLSYCENVRVSRQCDRGNAVGLKSSLLIPTEMIRLRQEVPPVQVR
ncbi:MAG: DUF2799 domain-containing protein [Gammaproteobacteria bacterium]